MEELTNTLMSILASAMTHDQLADVMQEKLNEYRKTGDFFQVEMACSLILKKSLQDAVGGMEAEQKRYEDFKKLSEVFEHTQNNS